MFELAVLTRIQKVCFKSNVVRWINLFDSSKVIWASEQEFFDNNVKPLKNEL
jgi:hypothetical protein